MVGLVLKASFYGRCGVHINVSYQEPARGEKISYYHAKNFGYLTCKLNMFEGLVEEGAVLITLST